MDTFASMPAAEREVYFHQAGASLGLAPQVMASYETAIRGTLRLVPPRERHEEIARDLRSMSEMFFDGPPRLADVISTLRAWEDSFNFQAGIAT